MNEITRFWDGRREDEVAVLNARIPRLGPCNKDLPMHEEWRKFANAYYRFYNDGDKPGSKLQHMVKRWDVDTHRHTVVWLETLGDKILDAALEEVGAGK